MALTGRKGPRRDDVVRVQRRPVGNGGKCRWMGIITFAGRQWFCAIGKNGFSARKREGDGCTPIGRYPFLFGYFRADRGSRVPSRMMMKAIEADDGWCDAPGDPNYNRPVELPYTVSHELMMRDDGLYDQVLVLDQNFSARMRGRGSAIFFHRAKTGFPGTLGCVAVAEPVMRLVLQRIRRGSEIELG